MPKKKVVRPQPRSPGPGGAPPSAALVRLLEPAPPTGECQHLRWTTRGNEPPGRVYCPDCKGLPRLREAIDALLLAALKEALR